ncbi:MAG: hypothetical protein AAFR39_02385 [Pseudomonadota bacterium]
MNIFPTSAIPQALAKMRRNPKRVLAFLGAVALIIAACVAAKHFAVWMVDQLPTAHAICKTMVHNTIIAAATLAHMSLMAFPFVPGAEIGLAMMISLGGTYAPLVYLSTVAALCLAFLAGRLIPEDSLARIFLKFGMVRAAELIARLRDCQPQERLGLLMGQAGSKRFTAFLLKNRCVALMAALNTPGNALIGGGGGICLVAGCSRLISFPVFLICAAIAVAPVPLVFFLIAIM